MIQVIFSPLLGLKQISLINDFKSQAVLKSYFFLNKTSIKKKVNLLIFGA